MTKGLLKLFVVAGLILSGTVTLEAMEMTAEDLPHCSVAEVGKLCTMPESEVQSQEEVEPAAVPSAAQEERTVQLPRSGDNDPSTPTVTLVYGGKQKRAVP